MVSTWKDHSQDTNPLCIVHHDMVHNDPAQFAKTLGREDILKAMLDNLIEYQDRGNKWEK